MFCSRSMWNLVNTTQTSVTYLETVSYDSWEINYNLCIINFCLAYEKWILKFDLFIWVCVFISCTEHWEKLTFSLVCIVGCLPRSSVRVVWLKFNLFKPEECIGRLKKVLQSSWYLHPLKICFWFLRLQLGNATDFQVLSDMSGKPD